MLVFSGKRIMVFLVAFNLIAACASTEEKQNSMTIEDLVGKAGFDMLEPVNRIQNYRVDGWNYLSPQSLIISAGAKQRYLVTLRTSCHGLRGASVIGTTSTASSLTKFESVVVNQAGGGMQKCPIDNLYKLKKIENTTEL